MKNIKDLIVVIPAYNEEVPIKNVINEWYKKLSEMNINFEIRVYNDGSTDITCSVVEELSREYDEIKCISKGNTGHGQTCVYGYNDAIKIGARFIFQIDSDGQCDPKFFKAFWENRNKAKIIIGYRVKRFDGIIRVVISKFTRLATYVSTFIYVKDPNVPYRLMHSDILSLALKDFPIDFNLANILLAVIFQKSISTEIKWLPIVFRDRTGGEPTVNFFNFTIKGFELILQLFKKKKFIKNRSNDLIKYNENT